MRKACEIRVKLVKNCVFLFSNLNTFLKSYVVGSSHYIFFFRLLRVPYINTNPFLHVLERSVKSDLNFSSSTQCGRDFSEERIDISRFLSLYNSILGDNCVQKYLVNKTVPWIVLINDVYSQKQLTNKIIQHF